MIAILGDIHANLPALEAVLADMPQVSAIWVCGDLIGELPYACEVLDRLMDLNVIAVRGNREQDLLACHRGEHPDWFQSSQYGCMAWTADQLKSYHWQYLESLPHPHTVQVGKVNAVLAHGAPTNVRGKVFTYEEACTELESISEDMLITGHTHKIRLFIIGKKVFIGAGSLGISLDGVGGLAPYVLFDETTGKIVFRQVLYDVEKVIRDTRSSELYSNAKGFSEATFLELLNGRYFVASLINFARTYAENELGREVIDIPDELWRKAEIIWDRQEWRLGREL